MTSDFKHDQTYLPSASRVVAVVKTRHTSQNLVKTLGNFRYRLSRLVSDVRAIRGGRNTGISIPNAGLSARRAIALVVGDACGPCPGQSATR